MLVRRMTSCCSRRELGPSSKVLEQRSKERRSLELHSNERDGDSSADGSNELQQVKPQRTRLQAQTTNQ